MKKYYEYKHGWLVLYVRRASIWIELTHCYVYLKTFSLIWNSNEKDKWDAKRSLHNNKKCEVVSITGRGCCRNIRNAYCTKWKHGIYYKLCTGLVRKMLWDKKLDRFWTWDSINVQALLTYHMRLLVHWNTVLPKKGCLNISINIGNSNCCNTYQFCQKALHDSLRWHVVYLM